MRANCGTCERTIATTDARELKGDRNDSDKKPSVCRTFRARSAGLEHEAFGQQERLSDFVENTQLVVKTAVLEEALDQWPGADLRRAQVLHSGTIWLSESGLSLSWVTPPLSL